MPLRPTRLRDTNTQTPRRPCELTQFLNRLTYTKGYSDIKPPIRLPIASTSSDICPWPPPALSTQSINPNPYTHTLDTTYTAPHTTCQGQLTNLANFGTHQPKSDKIAIDPRTRPNFSTSNVLLKTPKIKPTHTHLLLISLPC